MFETTTIPISALLGDASKISRMTNRFQKTEQQEAKGMV
jgi:hypothetical protein